jgi:hypothetical protein
MSEISQELLHELLRRPHQRADKADATTRDLRAENISLRRAVTGHQRDIDHFFEVIHRIEDRLDRIEARLDLREFNEIAQKPYDADH